MLASCISQHHFCAGSWNKTHSLRLERALSQAFFIMASNKAFISPALSLDRPALSVYLDSWH